MASYAPLFAHVEGWQWTPNLIWFDNLRSYGTPNYYVQKMFSTQIGTKIVGLQLGDESGALFGSATRDGNGDLFLKLVNMKPAALPADIDLHGMGPGSFTVSGSVLSSDDLKAENSLDQPMRIAPKDVPMHSAQSHFQQMLPGYSVTVLRVHGG